MRRLRATLVALLALELVAVGCTTVGWQRAFHPRTDGWTAGHLRLVDARMASLDDDAPAMPSGLSEMEDRLSFASASEGLEAEMELSGREARYYAELAVDRMRARFGDDVGPRHAASARLEVYRLSADYRERARAVAEQLAAERPWIGGASYEDRVKALYHVGLRYGISNEYAVRAVTPTYYRINHPASITYGSRSWRPWSAMQPPDGHDHNAILHSDSGGARGGPNHFGIDPQNALYKPNNDSTLVPGARGWGAGAGTGGRCVRGADLKILKPLDGMNGSGGEDFAADGSVSAILKDSLRNDSLDVVDINNITPPDRYFIEDGRVFLNDDRTSADGSLDASCLWVAGQTARGDGLAFSGNIWARDGFMHDLIITGVHFYYDTQGGSQPLAIFSQQDVLLFNNTHWLGNTEHFLVQTGCAVKDASGDWYPQLTARVSIGRSLAGESYATNWALGGCKGSWQDDGTMIDSDSIPNGQETTKIDAFQNLFTVATHRSPRGNGVQLRLVENMWYEWIQGAIELEQNYWADVIDNLFHSSGHGADRYEHRAVQVHYETGVVSGPFNNLACANRTNANSSCIVPQWASQFGMAHPLYPQLQGVQFYMSGNASERTRFLSDDSIQFRARSKYHSNVRDSLPEMDYDSAGIGTTTYHPSDTVASNASDPWVALMPAALNGWSMTKDTANTESPIPLDSDLTADSIVPMVESQELGAWWQLNADGTRRVEVDSAELLMMQHAADTANNIYSSANIDDLSDTHLGHLPSRDDGSSWTDSDGDGCPDAYEQAHAGSGTGMDCVGDPDGDGRSNYLEFLAGPESNPNVANGPSYGIESTGGGTAGTTTYGDGRIIHLVPAVVDTHITGGGADTVVRTIPDPDSVPIQGICIRIPDPDTSHFYAVTYDTLSPQPVVLDSAAAQDSMASLGTDRDIRTDPCFGH